MITCSLIRTQGKNNIWIFAIVNTKEEKYFKELGSKIKELREEKGLDQKAFAFDCEIGRTQLHMIENGKTNPRLGTLMKIANALEISLSKLVDLS
jgi:putative transcriptional regulator